MSAADLWTIGYGLDGGGYAFDPVNDGGPGDLVWEDADTDYFPFGTEPLRGNWGMDVLRIALAPIEWPKSWHDDDGGRWDLASEGVVYDSERECGCNGHPVIPSGAAGDHDSWEYTGSSMDPAHPDCARCGGSGYVDSPGGAYAWYVRHETPTLRDWRKLLEDAGVTVGRVWECGADWVDGALAIGPSRINPWDSTTLDTGTFLVPEDDGSWSIVRRKVADDCDETGNLYSDETVRPDIAEDDVLEAVRAFLANEYTDGGTLTDGPYDV